MASKNMQWQASDLYREPDYSFVNRLNPFLHIDIIEAETKRLEATAISEFTVTKLPRGGEDDHKKFKFSQECITQRVKAGRGCSPGYEKVEEHSEEMLQKIESRIANGNDLKTERLMTNSIEI